MSKGRDGLAYKKLSNAATPSSERASECGNTASLLLPPPTLTSDHASGFESGATLASRGIRTLVSQGRMPGWAAGFASRLGFECVRAYSSLRLTWPSALEVRMSERDGACESTSYLPYKASKGRRSGASR